MKEVFPTLWIYREEFNKKGEENNLVEVFTARESSKINVSINKNPTALYDETTGGQHTYTVPVVKPSEVPQNQKVIEVENENVHILKKSLEAGSFSDRGEPIP